jgi:hypothetical protein
MQSVLCSSTSVIEWSGFLRDSKTWDYGLICFINDCALAWLDSFLMN